MIVALVVIAALFIRTGTAQPEDPKCRETPDTWSGVLFTIRVGVTEAKYIISSANYDMSQRKVKITDMRSYASKNAKPLTTVLDDYEKRIRYIFSPLNFTCRNETLEGEFPSFGVPEDAHFDGPVVTLGAKIPGLGVTVAHYTLMERGFSYYTMHPLEDGTQCIPITTSKASLDPPEDVIVQYANVSTELPPDAFSLPPGC